MKKSAVELLEFAINVVERDKSWFEGKLEKLKQDAYKTQYK